MKSPALRLLPLLLSFCLPASLPAQEASPNPSKGGEKGVTPAPSTVHRPPSTVTRAVIIGISDYQSDAIPDLKYADRDAEAFAAYLQSPAGGSIPAENLKVLTNMKATNAQINAAFDWLMEMSMERDRAIIYFSGHGDVETKTMFQLGFLLTWDSPPNSYILGALQVSYLQAVVSTLSLQKKVEVTLITDACRAGKLAGSAYGGPQITNDNLSKQFANEVKILSCQPNELSIEGEQWGGGRGLFSYYLVDGLYGLADRNADSEVNLFELSRYLEDKVSGEAAPHSQFPMVAGDKNALLARVDAATLAQLKEQRSKQTPVLKVIDSKGFEDMLLAGIDSSWREKYRQFVAAVETGNLLDAPTGEPNAYDLYLELSQVEAIRSLHGTMQRNLAAALQDDAQQAINAYLAANPTELTKRYAAETDYGRYPSYLEKACELLGPEHFYYNNLMAKRYYFEGLQQRLSAINAPGRTRDSIFQTAVAKQLKALEYEPRSAFVFNELGLLYTELNQGEKAIGHLKKAIDITPAWGLPYVNLCAALAQLKKYEEALLYAQKAIELMPDNPNAYNFLAWFYTMGPMYQQLGWSSNVGTDLAKNLTLGYDNMNTVDQRKKMMEPAVPLLEKALELKPDYIEGYVNLGNIYFLLHKSEKAIDMYQKALELRPGSANIYSRLGDVYGQQLRMFSQAEKHFLKAIELDSTAAYVYNQLGLCYMSFEKLEEAEKAVKKAAALNPKDVWPVHKLASINRRQGRMQEAESYHIEALNLDPGYPPGYLEIGYYYLDAGRLDDAQNMFSLAIDIKPDYIGAINGLLDVYRQTGQLQKELEWRERLLQLVPEEPVAFYQAGRLFYLDKQPDKAKIHFDRAVQLGAGFGLLSGIARFCLDHTEYDWAKYYAQLARNIDSTDFYPYEILGWAYFMENRLEDAHKVLDKGIDMEKTAVYKGHLADRKGIIYFCTGELEKCEEFFQKSEAFDPASSIFEGFGYLGKILKEKDYAAIDSFFTPFTVKYPHSWEGWFLYAIAQAQLGKQDAAIESLKRSLEVGRETPYQLLTTVREIQPLWKTPAYQELIRRKFPEKYDNPGTVVYQEKGAVYYPENCITLARFYDSQGKQDRAKILYEKALSIQPDTLTNEMLLRRAEAYLVLGRYEMASSILPDKFEPDDVEQLLAIGKLYYQLGRPDKAEAFFNAYVQKSNSGRRARRVAWFYHEHNECELADQYLKLAREIIPHYDGTHYDMGWLYFSCGNATKAIQAMDEGIRVFPAEFDLKGIKAMILALSDPSGQPGKAFEAIEAERPDMAQIGACLNLMQAKKYEEATVAYKTITKEIKDWWVPRMLRFAYVRMLVAQGDLDAAMDEIDKGDTWVFSYPLLHGDAALAPLRETERFRAFIQRKFPEKAGKR